MLARPEESDEARPMDDRTYPTDALVDRLAGDLKAKLRAYEDRTGWENGWRDPAWREDCRRDLLRHVAKGDPLDVAAYAAFCLHHGWSTALDEAAAPPPASGERLPVSLAMQRAGVEELACSPAGEEARTAGGRALVRAIYRAMRHTELVEVLLDRVRAGPPEAEVVAVARALCALGCDPRLTADGAHPCGRCDAGADPSFRAEARAALRAVDAVRSRPAADGAGPSPVDEPGTPVAQTGWPALATS